MTIPETNSSQQTFDQVGFTKANADWLAQQGNQKEVYIANREAAQAGSQKAKDTGEITATRPATERAQVQALILDDVQSGHAVVASITESHGKMMGSAAALQWKNKLAAKYGNTVAEEFARPHLGLMQSFGDAPREFPAPKVSPSSEVLSIPTPSPFAQEVGVVVFVAVIAAVAVIGGTRFLYRALVKNKP